jgi:hypothetical protein
MKPLNHRQSPGLWLINGLLLGVALFIGNQLRWKKISESPAGTVWHRSQTIHVDRNRDGRVDEEMIRLSNGDTVVRRDSDLDGWFDLRYVERKGLVVQPEQIRERAPTH